MVLKARALSVAALLSFYPFPIIAFFAAVVVYAVLGSPTPDTVGVVEGIIAALLGVSFWKPTLMALRRLSFPSVFFIGGLSVPTFVGILYGNPAALILRDVIAFLFLSLPILGQNLWAAHSSDHKQKLFKYSLCAAFVGLGIIFSLRSLLDLHLLAPAPLTYFTNMPSVLFAALFCPFLAIYIPLKSPTIRFAMIVLVTLSFAPLAAMGLTLQRASLAYWVVFMISIFALYVRASPKRVLGALVLMVVMGVVFYTNLTDIVEALWDKTRVHGSNMRLDELFAVLEVLSADVPTALFGTGWGGTFESPAVADIRVNFTHSLLSSMLLKTGLIGFGCIIGYFVWVGQHFRGIFMKDRLVGFALLGPFLISVLLYASYKSFDFGFLLLLIVVLGSRQSD